MISELKIHKQSLIIISFLLPVMFIIGCLQQTVPQKTPSPDNGLNATSAWMEIELKDVSTGTKFRVTDFKGKPVLLESFAVWCPTCTEQQKKTKELKMKTGDKAVHISLDTDPNEDEQTIREHIELNGFDWYYAISPIELTRALIDEYGIKIVNAPAVPMVLICPDQSTRFLKSGIKTAENLQREIEIGC